MPVIPLLWLAGGALLGGGGVWIASDAAKNLTTIALIGGAFYLYTKRG